MKRFLPSSLAGQLITLLLLALIVAQGVSSWFSWASGSVRS